MKRFLVIFLVLLLCISALSMCAGAVTPDEGTIQSAALTYFEGLANKLPPNCEYVCYRTGDYTSEFAYGYGMRLDGRDIVSEEDVTIVTYNSRGSGTNMSYVPTISESRYNSINLTTTNTSIIYSSLGSWGSISNSKNDEVSYILWALVGLIFIYITFKFLRNRRHYINL